MCSLFRSVPSITSLVLLPLALPPVITTGSHRHKESTGLFGLQPIIEPSSSLTCKTGITLNAIKVGLRFAGSGFWGGHVKPPLLE
jgi:hypothetical protein